MKLLNELNKIKDVYYSVGPALRKTLGVKRIRPERSAPAQRGLAPRSTGTPTAGHQARPGGKRYAVRGTRYAVHFRQPGPGVLPLSPA